MLAVLRRGQVGASQSQALFSRENSLNWLRSQPRGSTTSEIGSTTTSYLSGTLAWQSSSSRRGPWNQPTCGDRKSPWRPLTPQGGFAPLNGVVALAIQPRAPAHVPI